MGVFSLVFTKKAYGVWHLQKCGPVFFTVLIRCVKLYLCNLLLSVNTEVNRVVEIRQSSITGLDTLSIQYLIYFLYHYISVK